VKKARWVSFRACPEKRKRVSCVLAHPATCNRSLCPNSDYKLKEQNTTPTTTMKTYNTLFGLIAAIGAFALTGAANAGNTPASAGPSPAAVEPTESVQYDLNAGYASEYLFRGIDRGKDLVDVSANVTVPWNGFVFNAGAWYGNFAQDYVMAPFATEEFNSNELDLYASVSKDFGFVTGKLGYIAYLFPDADTNKNLKNAFGVPGDTTQEIQFGLSRDFDFVNVELNYFWGVDGETYGYSELAFNRTCKLTDTLNVYTETNVGYLVDEGEFSAWTTTIALDWNFTPAATLSPFVTASVAMSDINGTFYQGSGNQLLGGLRLGVKF
jgi:Bacterial protein of unknown function (Gcw_chp)